jgi:hypothetical protein
VVQEQLRQARQQHEVEMQVGCKAVRQQLHGGVRRLRLLGSFRTASTLHVGRAHS